MIDAFPESPEWRALQLCTSRTGPRLTLEEAAAEAGCEERDVRSVLSTVYAELGKREDEKQLPARLG